MDRTTRQIAKASFIGAAVLVSVAFAVAPDFWWLGLLAGMAAGYLSYEFREVLLAIPAAYEAAAQDISGRKDRIIAWLRTPRSFEQLWVVICSAQATALTYILAGAFRYQPDTTLSLVGFALLIGPSMLGLTSLIYFTAVSLGSEVAEHTALDSMYSRDQLAVKVAQGYRVAPETYRNVLRWYFKGLGVIGLFLIWTGWKSLFIGLAKGLSFTRRFLWHLVKFIHSHERVLSAFGAAVGGTLVVWQTLYLPASLGQRLVFVLFGGLVGAAFGALYHRVVAALIRLWNGQVLRNA